MCPQNPEPQNSELHDGHERVSQGQWFSFYLHQDKLQWGRLQTLATIQLAALGAAYGIQEKTVLALAVIGLGFMLSTLVFFLSWRDEQWRFSIEKKLRCFNLYVPRKWYAPLKGPEIAWAIFSLLVVADVCLALVILW